MEQMRNKFHIFVICVSLALVTVITYEPIRKNEFVSYDDQVYVTENSHINTGITRESVFWAFTNLHVNTWHPLTSISHMLDC